MQRKRLSPSSADSRRGDIEFAIRDVMFWRRRARLRVEILGGNEEECSTRLHRENNTVGGKLFGCRCELCRCVNWNSTRCNQQILHWGKKAAASPDLRPKWLTPSNLNQAPPLRDLCLYHWFGALLRTSLTLVSGHVPTKPLEWRVLAYPHRAKNRPWVLYRSNWGWSRVHEEERYRKE